MEVTVKPLEAGDLESSRPRVVELGIAAQCESEV